MSELVFPHAAYHALQHDLCAQIEWIGRLVDANLRKHPLGAAELARIKQNLGVIMTRYGKCLTALLKENADLKAELEKRPPERQIDDDDATQVDAALTAANLDTNGDPLPNGGPAVTEASLTADLKASADKLTTATTNAQP